MSTVTQPDWNGLNELTAMYASSHFASDGTSCTLCQLHATISDLTGPLQGLAGKGGSPGVVLAVYVDTLLIDQDTITLPAAGAMIVARSIQLQTPSGNATLTVQSASSAGAFQILVQEVRGGTLTAALARPGGGAPVAQAVIAPTATTPTVYTLAASAPPPSTDPTAVADLLGSPLARNAMRASFTAASSLVYDTPADMAADMLRWVVACASAAAATNPPRANAPDVGSSLNDLVVQGTALLLFTQATGTGVTFVPLLSTDFYQTRISGLLGVAQSYDQVVSQLDVEADLEQALAGFASTLKANSQAAVAPLQLALEQANTNYQAMDQQYLQLEGTYALQTTAVADCLAAFQEGLKAYEQKQKIDAALGVVSAVVGLCTAVGAAMVGDPAPAMGAVAGAAAEVEQAVQATSVLSIKLIDVVKKLKPIFTTIAEMGKAGYEAYTAVSDYENQGIQPIKIDVPALTSSSLNGVDPDVQWDAFSVEIESELRPAIGAGVSGAQEYLDSLKILVIYGKALADKQIAKITLGQTIADAAAQLKAAQQAYAQWQQLGSTIQDKQQLLAARKSFVLQSYLNILRSLFVAVQDFRAAYAYRWLQQSPVQMSLNMAYPDLAKALQPVEEQINELITSSENLQDFEAIEYDLNLATSGDAPGTRPQLLTDGNGGPPSVSWTIALDDPQLSSKLPSKSQALYLTRADFFLVGNGAQAGDEIELDVATSGVYSLQGPSGSPCRFVAPQNFDLDAAYTISQRGKPSPTVHWGPATAVSAQYMKPSPFTQWTLKVQDGPWRGTTRIRMVLSGSYLRPA